MSEKQIDQAARRIERKIQRVFRLFEERIALKDWEISRLKSQRETLVRANRELKMTLRKAQS